MYLHKYYKYKHFSIKVNLASLVNQAIVKKVVLTQNIMV